MRGQYTLYCHVNKANGKKYVGITSRKPQERWGRGSGYAGQRFGSAIKKYGWDGFDHIILKLGMTRVDAEKEEKRLISAWKSNNVAFGYNVAEGGNLSAPGFAKIALRIKKENKTIRPVINLETLEVFDSCEEAAEHYGLNPPNISATLSRPQRTVGGFHWIVASDTYTCPGGKKTPVINLDTGELFESINDAAQKHNISRRCIGRACAGERPKAAGYRWAFAKECES